MSWHVFGPVLVWSALATFVWALIGFGFAVRAGRWNVVDTMWSLGFCTVAATSCIATIGVAGPDSTRRWLLLVCTLIWGLFLAIYIARRSAGDVGMWRWTCHPNNFGDAAVWAGMRSTSGFFPIPPRLYAAVSRAGLGS